MSSGRIIQIIGAVIDVEFERNSVPKIYDALQVDGTETTLEVQQQLGDGVVRTIAMGSTEGLKRGLNVTNTNAPISVPVGTATLAVSWTFLVARSTKLVLLRLKSVYQFTVKRLLMQNKRLLLTF